MQRPPFVHPTSSVSPSIVHLYKGGGRVDKGWTNRGEWVEIATVLWLLSLLFPACLYKLKKSDKFELIEGFVFPLLIPGKLFFNGSGCV